MELLSQDYIFSFGFRWLHILVGIAWIGLLYYFNFVQTEYVKEALPESLWARDGKEQLALITCGGAFNYQRNSYESNTVAIAVPI